MNSASDLAGLFREAFSDTDHAAPLLVQAPGRINLIGEHTDYNDGFVLPAAIQFQTQIAAGARHEKVKGAQRQVRVRSTLYADEVSFDLDEPHPHARGHWSDYVRGVALSLEQEGFHIGGANLLVDSDVPQGAGLSSSAALEVAGALAFLAGAQLHADPLTLARICRRAENDFVGTRSGVMDQFASCFGRKNHALLLDCRSLEVRYIPIPDIVALMVCNTMVKHSLASSEYNARRRQCEEAVALLAKFLPAIQSLRDVSTLDLGRFSAELDPVLHRRCRHVVEENRRVLAAVEALRRGDLDAIGLLMIESHQSLRLDYEVSCPELDLMCELALVQKNVYGARMVGGGFGGCVLALVQKSAAGEFQNSVAAEYRKRTGIACAIYECFAADGAGPLPTTGV